MKKLTKYLISNFDKIKFHSSDINKGDVFLALSGNNNHGNDFIDDAIKNGAKYIITDKKPTLSTFNENIIVVQNSLKFLKEISVKKRKLYKGKVIGITGSIGKTSIKENLKFFLTSYFIISASIKSYNNYLGVIISLINLNLKSDFAIFEIGTSDFFEIRKLTSIVKPSQVIISNIFQTHLENLITTRNIAIEKSDIFNPQYNSSAKLLIIPNEKLDEKFIINKAKKCNIEKIISIGKSSNSDLKIISLKDTKDLIVCVKVKNKDDVIIFCISKNQIHRINNILCCLAIFIYNKN
jgi:UDP-N-acetylmuramyl pentapeptide synthase